MMALEAPRLNIQMSFLDPSGSACPAALATGADRILKGALNDATQLRALASQTDILTIEIEHVGVDELEALEREGFNVQPRSRVVRIIQDKFVQKVRLNIRPWKELFYLSFILEASLTLTLTHPYI
jgi:phosphoribosylaminoimidazole carboxylase (NCAIR synthetase)